ncbi:DUF3847 domain-containing protein, partial [Dysosmobacter welbionis]
CTKVPDRSRPVPAQGPQQPGQAGPAEPDLLPHAVQQGGQVRQRVQLPPALRRRPPPGPGPGPQDTHRAH